ncbi:MAG: SDR family oxidoreductase [Ginsengibacter sp.]
MNLNLTNKIFLVTGGDKGIGRGIVKALAVENAIPVIIGKSEIDNKKALETIDNKGFQLVADISKPEECRNAIKKIIERYNCIDGLVNNEGINDAVDLENGNYENYISTLRRNLVQCYLVAHYAVPYLKLSKGAIVNIGSKTVETGQVNTSGYSESNGGRNGLTREWAVELLDYRIRVNAVIVAKCYTHMHNKRTEIFENSGEKLKSITDQIPLEQRMAKIEEIAAMVVFLLSERSGHTTGQIIHVDGGSIYQD